jgi:hypothetical protein
MSGQLQDVPVSAHPLQGDVSATDHEKNHDEAMRQCCNVCVCFRKAGASTCIPPA